ncbi:MAG: ABC transporter permease [Candidatus Caldatribacteriota bacterium]|nr:ABC transporter permease [Candidatus Caldatribacteriota bacterium]
MLNNNNNLFNIRSIYQKDPTLSILVIALLLIILTLFIFFPGRVLTVNNFESMAFQLPELGILSLAIMVTMLSGGINLSIIATANMAGIVSAFIMTRMITESMTGSPIPIILLAILAGWLVSLLIGIFNGVLIAYIGVSPILATLGTMTLVGGISILVTKGYVVSGFPEEYQYLGNGVFLGIPIPFLIFLGLAILVSILLRRTPFGIANYLIGSNETATRFSGINVNRTLVITYALSGLLCGIASTIMISRFNSAKAGYASSYLLITILISVLGGVDPYGGFGKISGLVLALFILQLVSSTFNFLGLSSHLTIAIWGLLLLITIGLRNIKPTSI